MKEVMTASGVMIRVPQPAVEQAKKTGTLTMANGVKIKVGKEDIEKAQQEKKGTTFMTAGGVPIKVTPSGAVQVPEKVSNKGQAAAVKKTGELAGKMGDLSTTPVKKMEGQGKKAPNKIGGAANGTAKKGSVGDGAAKKPPAAAPRNL